MIYLVIDELLINYLEYAKQFHNQTKFLMRANFALSTSVDLKIVKIIKIKDLI